MTHRQNVKYECHIRDHPRLEGFQSRSGLGVSILGGVLTDDDHPRGRDSKRPGEGGVSEHETAFGPAVFLRSLGLEPHAKMPSKF